MSDRKFELSRRNALIGLGTVGAASAGAGMGTSAYFSDQEEFTGNSVEAGEFSMDVEFLADPSDIDMDGMGDLMDPNSWASEVNDGTAAIDAPISISDLKPGDTYTLYWKICINDNPGVAQVRVEDPISEIVSKHGGNVEREDGEGWENVEGAGNVDPNGIYDMEETDNGDPAQNESTFKALTESKHITVEKELFGLDDSGDSFGDATALCDAAITYDPDDQYDWKFGGGLGNFLTSVGDGSNSTVSGLPIGVHDGEDGEGEEHNVDYVVIGPDGNYACVIWCVTIDVSTDAGNELQGAELEFDLLFEGEQSRHNDSPFQGDMVRDDLVDWDNPTVDCDQA